MFTPLATYAVQIVRNDGRERRAAAQAARRQRAVRLSRRAAAVN
jgi:hypothetical protein